MKEVEKYIMSLPNATKRVMHEWKSVRYTIYETAFATLSESAKGAKLTVWGRHPSYEKEFPKKITAASENEPLHFSDVYFECLPEEVVKKVIDYSYGKRLAQPIRPKRANADGNEKMRYCGIVSGYAEPNMPVASNGAITPDEAAAMLGIDLEAESENDELLWEEQTNDAVELESSGEWDSMPYAATMKDMKTFAELRKRIEDMTDCELGDSEN